MQEPAHSEWNGRTDGTPFMQKGLIVIFKVIPPEVMYGVMALVVPFYMLFKRKSYLSTYHFFRRRLGKGPLSAFFHVYLNHFCFGQIILDRFGAYAGKNYHFDIDGLPLMNTLEAQPDGFILLSSHVGNYEMAGYMLHSKSKRFNALVFAGETETVMENRQRILSQNNISMIPVREDLSHLFAVNAALENGEIVSLPADRIFGSQKSVDCRFFGEKASFPLGAFAMVVQKNVPVLAVFVLREGLRKYHAYVQEVTCDPQTGKREQMAQMAQNFAEKLEAIVRRYPTQWFNYYDFWKQ